MPEKTLRKFMKNIFAFQINNVRDQAFGQELAVLPKRDAQLKQNVERLVVMQ